MGDNLSSQVSRCIDVHQRKRRGRQVLTVLAAIVVFCTVYALMMPAVTMSNQVICGMEAHVHSEDCWTVELSGPRPELVCDAMDYSGVVIHQHNSFCYDEYGELICTLPETELHVHDESCYQEQRELICQERQEVGHVHDASCWAYDRGDLICTEAEGEDAHTHTDACYQTESRQVLTCALPEEEPHTHDDSCYTIQTRRELTCTLPESDDVLDEEGNVLEPGYHHDDSCYTEVEERELSCTREETEGHRHDESCYTTEEERTLICGHTETPGHEHGKECYEWTQRLVCQEEERETGHVHTDECYQITEVLACRRQELAPHTHTESCYNEEGGLVCTRPEAIVHDHDASCVHIPEGAMEEIRVLTCGKQEHEHTENCYVELVPKEDDGCLCGKPAHLHTAECYFEDGTLCCTMEEHIHTLACMQEAPPEEPKPEEPTGLWLAGDYTYENEEFHLTFHINGYAPFAEGEDGVLPDGQEPAVPTEPETTEQPEVPEQPEVTEKPAVTERPAVTEKPTVSERPVVTEKPAAPQRPSSAEKPAVTEKPEVSEEPVISETPETAEPSSPPVVVIPETPEPVEQTPPVVVIPEMPEPAEQTPPAVVVPEPEQPEDWGIATSTSTFFSLPSIGVSGLADGPYAAGSDTDGGDVDYWADRYVPIGEEQGVPAELDPADVVFSVEFHEEGESYENLATRAGELSEDEVLLLRVLTLSAAIDGRPLDLSSCTVEVEVTLAEQMLEQIESFSENQPMAIDGDGEDAVDGDEAGTAAPNVTLVAYSGEADGELSELGSVEVDEAEPRMTFTTRASDPMGLSLLMNVYPVFTVEYYAWIKNPATSGGAASLSFIDTSAEGNNSEGPKLPQNGTTPMTMNLQLNGDGTVLFASPEITQVYKDKKFQFNPNEEELTIEKMFGMMENTHYDISELWVLKDDVDLEAAEAVKTAEEAAQYWEIYSGNLSELRFTNNPKAASETVIPITSTTRFRLMYTQRSGTTVNSESVFYDYDITDGTRTGSNPITVNSNRQGINSPSNYPEGTSDAKFGFGNANTGSGLENEIWLKNKINQANRDVGYELCTFGLVKGFAGGTIVYSDGVTGPNLFGGTPATGKTCYDQYSLKFLQEGDTHTLSAVLEGGSVVLGNLENFGHPGGYSIWTNGVRDGAVGFWPLDGLNREGADPEFGGKNEPVVKSPTYQGGFPPSDNGKNHNAYFGMNYSVQFELSEEYVGPLEYYFYGDDDMWVFLGDKLVCDIGGVHKSVGEYVDLWDYIPGGRENHKANTYTLSVFYTERGASGSTCWMQYTLPNAIAVPVIKAPNQENTPLTIKKVVGGNLASDELRETFYTFDLTLLNTMENYQATVYDEQDRPVLMKKQEDGVLIFDEEHNDDATLPHSFTVSGGEKLVFTLRDGWYLRIADLSPYAGYDVNERFPDDKPPEGCATTVQVTKGSNVGQAASGTNGHDESMGMDKTTVTFTNTFEYELPETGGSGTVPYALAGGLLITAALWLWYRKKTAEGRGADTT